MGQTLVLKSVFSMRSSCLLVSHHFWVPVDLSSLVNFPFNQQNDKRKKTKCHHISISKQQRELILSHYFQPWFRFVTIKQVFVVHENPVLVAGETFQK